MSAQDRNKVIARSRRMTDGPNFPVIIRGMTTVWRRLPPWFGRDIILPFAATRIALCLIAWIGFRLLPLPSAFPLSWEIGANGSRHSTGSGVPSAHDFVNMWSRWDSGWYLHIARFGYQYDSSKPSSTAFFPVYPLTIRLLHASFLLPDSDFWYLVAAIAVANICLLVAATYLYRLIQIDYAAPVAARTTLLLYLFPTSFFLSAGYSESMFLMLTVSSFYYARKQYWFSASLLAALATACRSQGIILLAPLLVEYFGQCKPRPAKWNIVTLLFIPIALAALAFYFKVAFGSWTILFDSQRPWGRRFLAPWSTLDWVLGHASGHDWLDFCFLALLAFTTAGAVRLRPSYTTYLLAAVLFFSCWGMLGSVPRFVVVIFPMFIVLSLAMEKSRAFQVAYLTISSILAATFFFLHSQWNWIA